MATPSASSATCKSPSLSVGAANKIGVGCTNAAVAWLLFLSFLTFVGRRYWFQLLPTCLTIPLWPWPNSSALTLVSSRSPLQLRFLMPRGQIPIVWPYLRHSRVHMSLLAVLRLQLWNRFIQLPHILEICIILSPDNPLIFPYIISPSPHIYGLHAHSLCTS